MNPKFISISFFLFFSVLSMAQETLFSLEFNATVSKLHQKSLMEEKSGSYDTVTNTLPFFDDFSEITTWPSALRWADNYIFVNTDYAKEAPTIGVATLDAIDEKGALYPNAGPYQFEADILTSQPIRLDSLFSPVKRAIKTNDSIYLSFFYQPQGKGSMPAKKDSLILEFHSPVEFDTIVGANDTLVSPKWRSVWSSPGGIQVDTFAVQNGTFFKQVLIPLTDSALYFKNGFRFRFRNFASLANNYLPDWQSNGDHWNLDVILLNTGRSVNDTVIKDVAFADRAPSMLKRYEAMPYKQYRENFVEEMQDSLHIKIANLDNFPQNISYKYFVQRDSQDPFKTYEGGSYSIFPFLSTGYSTYQPFARPPVNFLYSPFETHEKVAFHTTHVISTDPALIIKGNDTIRFTQLFSNYYAYDDGTAEAGIGLNGASGSYAVRFELNTQDTLIGMQLFFNQVRSGNQDEYIDLSVWSDYFGKPGVLVKSVNEVTPVYTDSLNTFHTYWFESPLVVDATTFPGLIFYVGWQQTSIDNINIGLDRHNDSHQQRFYNVDGTWQMSDELHSGSLMLRPVLGSANPISMYEPVFSSSLKVYPNPLSDGIINIELPLSWKKFDPSKIQLRCYSSIGSLILTQAFSINPDLDALAPGIYIVEVIEPVSGERLTNRLIIL